MVLFKYTLIIFIASILDLYHMYNGIMHKQSELKVKFYFLNISVASASASILLT